jgi:hypothetical protein
MNEGELTSARLVMLGVIHRDRESAALLSRWLDYLKPEVITVEFSRYGMVFRKTHGTALRARLDAHVAKIALEAEPPCPGAVESLHDYIDLPYEYTETSQYADRSGIPLHLLDLDLFSYVNLRSVDELMEEKNLRTWFGGHVDHENEVEKQRALARLFFDKGVRAFPYTNEMLTRDRHVKGKLDLLTRRHQDKRILHVCGWQHLSDQHNIYRSLNPVKVFVHDRSVCV